MDMASSCKKAIPTGPTSDDDIKTTLQGISFAREEGGKSCLTGEIQKLLISNF